MQYIFLKKYNIIKHNTVTLVSFGQHTISMRVYIPHFKKFIGKPASPIFCKLRDIS